MKTDTLSLVVAEGSQTGLVIRTVVKDVLDQLGYEANMTTDDASAPRDCPNPPSPDSNYRVTCRKHNK